MRLASFERFDVAHQPYRVAHARADVSAAAARRRQPLDFASREVENVHDRARYAEHFAQRLNRRARDRLGRLLGSDRAIDLVQDLQALGMLAVCLDEAPIEHGVLGQEHREHETCRK